MNNLDISRSPAVERLVPSVNEDSVRALIEVISGMEANRRIDWKSLKSLAGWPHPQSAEEIEIQQTRHTLLVEGINRHARKLDIYERFQLRVIRGEGVLVLKGDQVVEHRKRFETTKVEKAAQTAVRRLKRELDSHQENMTPLGRFKAKHTLKVFNRLSKRTVEDLQDMLEELDGLKAHWKNTE